MPDTAEQTTRQRVTDGIADALENRPTHPGNLETKQAPVTMVNPMFRTKGRPPHQVESIRASNRLIAELVVHVIETELDCRIVPNSELAAIIADRDRLLGDNE